VEPNTGISVVIIAYNEANNIGNCIDSVIEIANEILVVDSFSTDNTVSIALNKGARVLQHHFEGHIQQKNWAKDQAAFDWVLSLDADECLSQELVANLKTAIQKGLLYAKTKGYSFSRLNHLGSSPIRGCGWYPDIKLRLWDKQCGVWAGRNPHDKFVLNDAYSLGTLPGDILHYTYPDLNAVKQQAIKFGKIGGLALKKEYLEHPGLHRGVIFYLIVKLLTAGLARFLRNYVLKGGWKYGFNGLSICFWQTVEVSYKYGFALFGKNSIHSTT
jgi:glycosyltransferase involved in cell wall biosynthesis